MGGVERLIVGPKAFCWDEDRCMHFGDRRVSILRFVNGVDFYIKDVN